MKRKNQTYPELAFLVIMTGFLLLSKFPAQAVEPGLSLGPALPLNPAQGPGVAGGLSAVISFNNDNKSNILRARGEVLGFITQNGKAALPTLTGDLGLSFGSFDVFLTGGVELFGVAWRGDYTLFSTLGFGGGLGLTYQITSDTRLGLRGLGIWLPSFALAILDAPPSGEKPTIAFVSVLLSLEFSSGTGRGGGFEDDF